MAAKIGKYCTISDDVKLGENVVIHGHANLYGCDIQDDAKIGTFVEIQSGAVVGKRVRIQSHTFVCSDVVIEDDVFIGHNVNFINDRYPTVEKAGAKNWKVEGCHVSRGASIGTGAIILCGVTVGEGALVGAGSMVAKDVPPHTIVAGVPAKVVRVLSLEERWEGGQPNSSNQINE